VNLLAQQLQRAGLAFISAKARHLPGGLRIDDIVCPTQEDADKVDAWAAKEGYPVKARVATSGELADWQQWQELT
jgi:hypothetical protein